LSRELDITEYEARQLLEGTRPASPTPDTGSDTETRRPVEPVTMSGGLS
jgi:hypothetical protein